eukprot:UN00903
MSWNEETTGMGNPVMGDSERCSDCGQWKDYACDDVYICYDCIGGRSIDHVLGNKKIMQPENNSDIIKLKNNSDNKKIMQLNGQMLDDFKNGNNKQRIEVVMVGEFKGMQNELTANFEASDGRMFAVNISQFENFNGYNTKFVQIRGKLQNDGMIQQKSYVEFGNDFDMSIWNKLLVLMQKYPNLF